MSPDTVAIRRNSCRAVSCSTGSSWPYSDSARRAMALRTPPMRSYVARSSTRPFASVEQLGQRILEQRQRVRLAGDVGDQSPDEAWFDGDVELAGGKCRSGLELVGAERHDGDDVVGEQLAQTGSASGRS